MPSAQRACPHCDHTLPTAPAGEGGFLSRVGVGLMASSTAMTLMACYGAPCPDEDSCGDGGSAGPLEETCDLMTPTEDLGVDAPVNVSGTLTTEGSNVGSCGGAGGEMVYTWTPPSAGTYTISTEGQLDTVLYVRDAVADACGVELACNDDEPGATTSSLTLDLTGEPIAIVVDGFSDGTAGDFTLSIQGS